MNNKHKILFLINSLRPGGAEKVLVNLVNGLNQEKYDITVMTLFGGGANKEFLNPGIRLIEYYKKAPKGFVYICKLFSPSFLHRHYIKEKYDLEVSYLQGVTTRIIGGAPLGIKTIAWMHNCDHPEVTFRSMSERTRLLKKFDSIASVSKIVDSKVKACINESLSNCTVIYNTQDVNNILNDSATPVPSMESCKDVKIVTAGTVYNVKGYSRLLKSLNELHRQGYKFHMYFVGDGPQRKELEEYVTVNDMSEYVTFFGFDKNPYKYMSKADFFVCSSYTEGFSGTVSEATILGIPTLTTRCAGMDEILGENNEYGVIVDNTDEALHQGLLDFLSKPELLAEYKERVKKRKDFFNPETTIKQAEDLFDSLIQK